MNSSLLFLSPSFVFRALQCCLISGKNFVSEASEQDAGNLARFLYRSDSLANCDLRRFRNGISVSAATDRRKSNRLQTTGLSQRKAGPVAGGEQFGFAMPSA